MKTNTACKNGELACRHVQVYPIGFARHPNKIGIFLAGCQSSNQENPNALAHLKFRLTLINQQNTEKSIAAGHHPDASNQTCFDISQVYNDMNT